MSKVAILFRHSNSGMHQDALIMKDVIEKINGLKCDLYDSDQLRALSGKKYYLISIFIEHIKKVFLEKIDSDYRIFKPNVELMQEWDIDLINEIDFVMCKTQICQDYLRTIIPSQIPIIFTKFTSFCNPSRAKKDFNLAIHFAGKSPFKGTEELIRGWLFCNGFLNINPDLKLLMTKRYFLKTKREKKLISYLESLPSERFDSFYGRKISGKKINNIYIVEQLTEKDHNYFLQKAGFVLAPSAMEGYGHYINEGRCGQSVVITSDIAPMNELITDPNRLIKIHHEVPNYQFDSDWYLYKGNYQAGIIDFRDFCYKFSQLLRKTEKELIEIAALDRKQFELDTEFFEKAFSGLIDLIIDLDGQSSN